MYAHELGPARFAKYALVSTVLPRVVETASFAQRVRAKLMGIHRRLEDGDPLRVSVKFSGKSPDGVPLQGHRHAFYVPCDEDRDGRLDHLLIYAADPFDHLELMALDRLRSIWQADGRPDVKMVLTSLGSDAPGEKSSVWVSATPFVTARHHRKGRGTYLEWLNSEVARECVYHGLPVPARIDWISCTLHTGRSIRWFEFVRGRKNERPFRGHGCVITFDRPVSGPILLGAACHFGLGLFVPFDR